MGARGKQRVSSGLMALVLATLVIVIVGIIVAVKLTSGSGGGSPTVGAPTDVVQAATNVPAADLAAAGLGAHQVIGIPLQVKPPPPLLTLNGKPEVLYVGAEYCPYCAAERWSMVVALSRFGTFSGLKATSSSSTDIYPSTQTFSFYGSSYTSKYLSFVPVEKTTNTYAPLQKLTGAENKVFLKYDVPPYSGSANSTSSQGNPIPFIDLANRYIEVGAEYNPQVLHGLSLGTIAGSLTVPSSPVAQGIEGGANYFTAALCKLTNSQPTSVCSGPVIAAAQATLARKT